MPANKTSSNTVDINGYALREIRVRSGIGARQLAEQINKDRTYISKIENGHPRVSVEVFNLLLAALVIEDRRVLLAAPHVEGAEVAA